MACVSVDLRPKFIENPNHITIYSTEVPSGLIVIQEDNENLFLNKYDEAFRISVIFPETAKKSVISCVELFSLIEKYTASNVILLYPFLETYF